MIVDTMFKNKKYRKSQLALEFVLLMGFLIVLVAGIIAFAFEANRGVIDDKINLKMEDFSYSIQNEFLLAAEMNDGYVRTISIPSRVENTDYNISVGNKTLIVQYGDNNIYLRVPNVSGNIRKGYNILSNKGGVVFINK